jgi:HlyD family secretion protein
MDIALPKPAKARSRLLVLGALILFAGFVATFAFARDKRDGVTASAVDARSTWVERVRRGDLLRQVPAQGTFVPEHVEWLSAQTAARVSKIAVRPGAAVDARTVVVVLENTDLELAALEAERQAASAEARLIDLDVKGIADEKSQAAVVAAMRVELRDADRHAANANRLGSEGLVSENERRDAVERVNGLGERKAIEEARQINLVSGRARQIAAQRAEIERLREIAQFRRRQLSALEVRAGIDGIVQDIPLERGQWVAIGTLLAKVAEPSHLKAEMKVAEASSRDLQKGQTVRFEGSTTGHGRVTRVDPAVVAGSVKIEVSLADDVALSRAKADMAVMGYVEIEKLDNVLFVARPAGVREQSTASIFRVDAADKTYAARVSIKIGRGSAKEVEIVDGLNEGDEVVVSDVSMFGDATRVRLK